MKIRSYLHDYDLEYAEDFSFLEQFRDILNKLVIIDRKVYKLYKEAVDKYFESDSLIMIDALEDNKSIESALSICEAAMKLNGKRNIKLIAIGGGIIQDISAFSASILFRGVGLVLVPTTLLAQGDSCIGSKTSINYLDAKNILGTFYPPEKVFVCLEFVNTLSDMDYNSGLGEIVRYRIMESIYNTGVVQESLEMLKSRDFTTIKRFMGAAHAYKKKMIELDEFDLNERRIFNYGHTFGHAYESISNYEIPHGLAILLGMITANKISLDRGLIDEAVEKSIRIICLELYNAGMLCCDDMDVLINILKKDKKRRAEGIAAVLLYGDSSLKVVQDVSRDEVVNAVRYTQDCLKAR